MESNTEARIGKRQRDGDAQSEPHNAKEGQLHGMKRVGKGADTKHKDMCDASGRILGYLEMLRTVPALSATGARLKPGDKPAAGNSDCKLLPLPAGKVGSLEIYARFPLHYDHLMSRHDCSELGDVLERIAMRVVDLTTTSSACSASPTCRPSISLLDLGCGTGRISRLMAARYGPTTTNTSHRPLLTHVVGYDKYGPMLRVFDGGLETELAAASRKMIRVDVPTENAAQQALGHHQQDTTRDEGQVAPLLVCLRPASYEALRSPMNAEGSAPVDTLEGIPTASEHILLPSAHWRSNLIVMAWSLSYVVRAQWGADTWHGSVDALMNNLLQVATPRAAIVVVETLGTGTNTPTRRITVAEYLQTKWGFINALELQPSSTVSSAAPQDSTPAPTKFIRTDYRFDSLDQGQKLCNFFFASGSTAEGIEQEPDGKGFRLKECTGVWVKFLE